MVTNPAGSRLTDLQLNDEARAGSDFPRLSRRRLLRMSTAVVGGLAGSYLLATDPVATRLVEASEAPAKADIVSGEIVQVEGGGVFTLRDSGGKDVAIQTTDTTSFVRIGEVANFNDFVPGDEVVSEGAYVSGEFQSDKLVTLYHGLEGELVSRTADTLVTAAGSLTIDNGSIPWELPYLIGKPLDDLAVGDVIVALARRHPVSDALHVVQVGVRPGNS